MASFSKKCAIEDVCDQRETPPGRGECSAFDRGRRRERDKISRAEYWRDPGSWTSLWGAEKETLLRDGGHEERRGGEETREQKTRETGERALESWREVKGGQREKEEGRQCFASFISSPPWGALSLSASFGRQAPKRARSTSTSTSIRAPDMRRGRKMEEMGGRAGEAERLRERRNRATRPRRLRSPHPSTGWGSARCG